jgi:hypothetical protein
MWVTVWKDDGASVSGSSVGKIAGIVSTAMNQSTVIQLRKVCVYEQYPCCVCFPVCRPINDSTEPIEAQGPFEVINPDTISE